MYFLHSVFDKSDFLKYHEHCPVLSWNPSYTCTRIRIRAPDLDLDLVDVKLDPLYMAGPYLLY